MKNLSFFKTFILCYIFFASTSGCEKAQYYTYKLEVINPYDFPVFVSSNMFESKIEANGRDKYTLLVNKMFGLSIFAYKEGILENQMVFVDSLGGGMVHLYPDAEKYYIWVAGSNEVTKGAVPDACNLENYRGPTSSRQDETECKMAFEYSCTGNKEGLASTCILYKKRKTANPEIPDCPYCN